MAEKITPNTDAALSEALDSFSNLITVPVNKLDADEYTAEDLDGVTESLFGSGNLNFLSMQAGQANDAIILNDALNAASDELSLSNLSLNKETSPTFNSGFSNEDSFRDAQTQLDLTDTDRSIGDDNSPDVDTLAIDGNFTNTTIGSIGASTLSSDVGAFSPSSNLDLNGDTNINESNTGDTNVVNNTTNDTVQNVVNTVNETIENITNFGDEIIENILEGDITEILNTAVNDLTVIINNLLEQTTNLTEILNLGDTILNITDITNNIFDLLGEGGIALNLNGDLLDSLGIDAGIILDDTISGLVDVGLVTKNIDTLVTELTGLNLPVIGDLGAVISLDLLNFGDAIDNSLGDTDLSITGLDLLGMPDLHITLDPVETILGDIDIGLDIPAALADPQNLLSGVQDTIGDLSNLDVANIDEALDILGDEGLSGALDLELFDTNLNESFDLTGNDLLGGLEDILGDIDLANPQDALQNMTDELNDSLAGIEDLADTIPLDLIEEIVGDIDLDIGFATDILGDLADPLVNDGEGGTGEASILTEVNDIAENIAEDALGSDGGLIEQITEIIDPVLEDALDLLGGDGDLIGGLDDIWTEEGMGGGLFDDIIGGDLSGEGGLPNPIGDIAGGLGGLDIPLDNGGGLGGLFG